MQMRPASSTKTGYKISYDSRSFCHQCLISAANSSSKLLCCGGCGMVSYCSRACQLTARTSHRNICMQYQAVMNPERSVGYKTLLYDRTFSGMYSIFQRHSFHEKGAGVVVCNLSHDPEIFSIPRGYHSDLIRTIQFSYCSTEKEIYDLDQELAKASFNDDGEVFELVKGSLLFGDQMESSIPNHRKGMVFPMFIRSSSDASLFLMANWFSDDHPATTFYSKQSSELMNFEVVDSLNIVGPIFFEDCMKKMRMQAKIKPGSSKTLFPPLALELSIMKNPNP